jgi:hypothetical protein
MRTLGATVVVAALGVIGAAPASGGFGFAEALRTAPQAIAVAGNAKSERTKISCQAGDLRAHGSSKPIALGEKLSRKWLPVACEQPPRSQMISDALKHASAAALSLYG